MSDLTSELNLALATDNDDLADYLDAPASSLRTSLITVDGLFNTTTGHTHNGAHQGGPIGSITAGAIPDGSVTAAKIAPGAVGTTQLADGGVTSAKIADGTIQDADIAVGVINVNKLNQSTSFSAGPTSSDWFRNSTNGQGVFNTAANRGLGIDANGLNDYPSGDRVVTATAAQTLSSKTLNSPTVNSPTLAGTVSGAPTWASPQAFAAPSTEGGRNLLATVANALDWKIDYGSTVFASVPPSGGVQNNTITFDVPFAAAPFVMLSPVNCSGGMSGMVLMEVGYSSVAAGSFTMNCINNSGGSQTLVANWIAIGR